LHLHPNLDEITQISQVVIKEQIVLPETAAVTLNQEPDQTKHEKETLW